MLAAWTLTDALTARTCAALNRVAGEGQAWGRKAPLAQPPCPSAVFNAFPAGFSVLSNTLALPHPCCPVPLQAAPATHSVRMVASVAASLGACWSTAAGGTLQGWAPAPWKTLGLGLRHGQERHPDHPRSQEQPTSPQKGLLCRQARLDRGPRVPCLVGAVTLGGL